MYTYKTRLWLTMSYGVLVTHPLSRTLKLTHAVSLLIHSLSVRLILTRANSL